MVGDPDRDIGRHRLAFLVAQQQVIALLVEGELGIRPPRHDFDGSFHRLLRDDAVAQAMQHQVGHVHARRRLARGVHQVDQPVAHVEPRLAHDLRIVAQLLERLGVVGRLVVDRCRTGGKPRDGVGEEP